MIFKIDLVQGSVEYATAENQLHLLKSYDEQFGSIQEIETITEITEEDAKTMILTNSEYNEDKPDEMPKEFSLFDLCTGDDFELVGGTDY